MLLGGIAGMLVGGAITEGKSDLVQDIATDIGGDLGAEAVRDKYGKIIYHLTLALDGWLGKTNSRSWWRLCCRSLNKNYSKQTIWKYYFLDCFEKDIRQVGVLIQQG